VPGANDLLDYWSTRGSGQFFCSIYSGSAATLQPSTMPARRRMCLSFEAELVLDGRLLLGR